MCFLKKSFMLNNILLISHTNPFPQIYRDSNNPSSVTAAEHGYIWRTITHFRSIIDFLICKKCLIYGLTLYKKGIYSVEFGGYINIINVFGDSFYKTKCVHSLAKTILIWVIPPSIFYSNTNCS